MPFNYVKASADYVLTKHNAQFEIHHDWLLGESRWSPYAKSIFVYDEFRPYSCELTLNAGIGYRFIKAENTTLTGRFGSGASRKFHGSDNEWEPEAMFGVDFEHKISDRQKLRATVEYYPEWDDFGLYRIRSDVGWEMLLDERTNMSLKLGVIDRYDTRDSGQNGRTPSTTRCCCCGSCEERSQKEAERSQRSQTPTFSPERERSQEKEARHPPSLPKEARQQKKPDTHLLSRKKPDTHLLSPSLRLPPPLAGTVKASPNPVCLGFAGFRRYLGLAAHRQRGIATQSCASGFRELRKHYSQSIQSEHVDEMGLAPCHVSSIPFLASSMHPLFQGNSASIWLHSQATKMDCRTSSKSTNIGWFELAVRLTSTWVMLP